MRDENPENQRGSIHLTQDWEALPTISLYLNRCQVDTPSELVKSVWKHVHLTRPEIGKVVDFGAGDGRFSEYGRYRSYFGYEIDSDKCLNTNLPLNATLYNSCAFTEIVDDADLCIGNPPFVRNQDLPPGWRSLASRMLIERTGVAISGLANAWQYFFLLGLASIKSDGLCALILPFEWVSRPSVQTLRDYIHANSWNVSVYRLIDTTFNSVLTTSSITIVDKSVRDGVWNYFEETGTGTYDKMSSPSGSLAGVIKYAQNLTTDFTGPRAVRGLSPGTQKVFTLTEGERIRFGLEIDRDVVPCITTLRHLPISEKELNETNFQNYYVTPGKKCWLIVTQTEWSEELTAYLDSVSPADYQTSTCLVRRQWWNFSLPQIPKVFVSMGFIGKFPKVVTNLIDARAVGSVCGIHNMTDQQIEQLTTGFENKDIRDQVVAHSHGLLKIEINQLNTLLHEIFSDRTANKLVHSK